VTSLNLTAARVSLINDLVGDVCLLGLPAPGQLAKLDAIEFAGKRSRSAPVNEAELRAIIYDRLFPVARSPLAR